MPQEAEGLRTDRAPQAIERPYASVRLISHSYTERALIFRKVNCKSPLPLVIKSLWAASGTCREILEAGSVVSTR